MSRYSGNRSHRAPLQPDRVRSIERGFAFVPNRFLHGGFFASLSHTQRSLYLFLVLAGDRNGVSYYAYDRICTTLEITLEDYVAARNALIDKDLVAFDGTCFQILSLPQRPVLPAPPPRVTHDNAERDDLATIGQLIRSSLDRP